jgi:hypothetical protein
MVDGLRQVLSDAIDNTGEDGCGRNALGGAEGLGESSNNLKVWAENWKTLLTRLIAFTALHLPFQFPLRHSSYL